MEQWERDQIREANAHLRLALDGIQADFDREMAELADVQRKLAMMKVHATTPNNLARVTVNASGQVTEVTLADDAFLCSTPKQLAAELNAAIHGAVEAAGSARDQLLEPITMIVNGMPDLDQLVPGAPSLRELRNQLSENEKGV
ncbi:YbaB/EbfC family nucleoid-associated protein [Nocardia huaxiensis]|uniref:YbaB/EbfC family nucleoid-associated protein n=1 Tax=Nocardia huaxiensis TaxID=2755382 RepID=UPI001E53C94E|nr:YbaB/EbfC family nucleoid-associated protein [Nocardia huaxiensis]UFS94253.1 YbaB/EbfC family nucleoid-associated protein [Nocardia huaxiensis]